MNEAEAKAHVALILGDVATQLTPADYTHVLARSLTFDTAGLKPGDQLITGGLQYVQAGAAVQIAPVAASAPAAK